MKKLLSTTIILGFIASTGIGQASEAAVIQPLPSLTHQDQLIHVRGKTKDITQSHHRGHHKRIHADGKGYHRHPHHNKAVGKTHHHRGHHTTHHVSKHRSSMKK